MSDDVIHTSAADGVAVVTLNRPEARNALSRALLDGLSQAMASCEASADIDVVILTGTDPAFCAGLDLRDLGASDLSVDDVATDALPPMSKPVIGAVNGPAVTGGLEVVLACDFVIASERARFADTHARIGVMPGWGLTVRLAESIGQRRAREMSMTGNFVDADTALTWGLVNHVVPHDELLPFSRALAADIVSNDRAGVRELLSIYQAQDAHSSGSLRALESEHRRQWSRGGSVPPEEIARRRATVIERGRTQL